MNFLFLKSADWSKNRIPKKRQVKLKLRKRANWNILAMSKKRDWSQVGISKKCDSLLMLFSYSRKKEFSSCDTKNGTKNEVEDPLAESVDKCIWNWNQTRDESNDTKLDVQQCLRGFIVDNFHFDLSHFKFPNFSENSSNWREIFVFLYHTSNSRFFFENW